MIRLKQSTIDLIQKEMESIPAQYHKSFHSTHEGYAVLLEEVKELEQEIFFGEKPIKEKLKDLNLNDEALLKNIHRERIRKEAIQVAAMATRIIQELT